MCVRQKAILCEQDSRIPFLSPVAGARAEVRRMMGKPRADRVELYQTSGCVCMRSSQLYSSATDYLHSLTNTGIFQ